MAYFITDLDAKRVGDVWILDQDLVYKSDFRLAPIVVPKGFETDFASVPRLPLAFWLTGDTAHQAAVVHDFLYVKGTGTKEEADSIFLEAMKVIGVPLWRRQLMYAAVRLFGRGNFEERREQPIL